MKLIKNKAQFAWVLYDWANSAFATTVMAGFFPVFFKSYWSATTDVNTSTAYLGIANSIASLLVAIMAPVLGAIADQGKSRKGFLIFFAYMSILMTGCLFMVEMGNWQLAAFLYILGAVGFSGGNIFYDSLLQTVTTEKNIDYISAKGYAFGYLGGGILFLINVLWYTMPGTFGFAAEITSDVTDIIPSGKGYTIMVKDDTFGSQQESEFKAYLTSQFTSEILTVEKMKSKNHITITLQEQRKIAPEYIEKTVYFGGYKKAEVVSYQPGRIVVENLTRKLKESDQILIPLRQKIIIDNCKEGICQTTTPLRENYDNIQIETNLLVPTEEYLPIRLSFLSVALWWSIFTIPLILWLKEKKNKIPHTPLFYIKKGFGQLSKTFQEIRHLKYIFIFLLAYWLYIDGVNTVIRMAVDYGMSLGFPSQSLIIALLITQFVGFPSALFFGKLGSNWDVKKSLYIGIFVYLAINLWAVFMNNPIEFYFMAVIIGLVQGGIQALSRSMYSRLIPENKSAEYYGFYNMVGKFAAIFGPGLVGIINVSARFLGFKSNAATRIGIGSLAILFIGGSIFLYFVDIDKGKKQVKYLKN